MKRTMILGAAIMTVWLGLAAVSQAQVFVRAPFVRVGVGNGVWVRAPFVNLWVPGDGPAYYSPYGPRVIYMPPPGYAQQPPPQSFPPAPQPVQPPITNAAPPQPVQKTQAPTLAAFASTFQPKAGSYDVTLVNPVTLQPTNVKFALPAGSPRRVLVTRDSLEFIYSLRQWVRIDFDRNGVTVTSR